MRFPRVDTAILLHGFASSPELQWMPWMRRKLEARGITVHAPAFPERMVPRYAAWLAAVRPLLRHTGPRTIIIGHSLGGVMATRMLEQLRCRKVAGAVLVAAPFGTTFPAPPYLSFFTRRVHWKRIQKNAGAFVVVHAVNDPLIPYDHSYRYAEALDADHVLLDRGGHFAGTSAPAVWDAVRRLL